MILSLAILLLAGQVESDCVRVPRAGGCVRANGRSGAGFAFFEAFPASGAGTAGVCSTTAPTGAKGEVLTFTRASSATCTKTAAGGLVTTGIAVGDLVVLSSNVSRVEYDSQGYLGLLMEASRINYLLRSEAPSNAVWTKESSGAATTVTADQAAAPDEATTADRMQAIATSGVGFADIYQAWTASGANTPTTCSAFIRGTSNSDTTDICLYDGATWSCTACPYVSGSYSRCYITDTVGAAASRFCKLGNNSGQNGGVARNALDASIWGFQGEESLYPTSYIPTGAATATRAAEAMKVNGSAFPAAAYSKAVSITTEWATASAPTLPGLLLGEVGVASGTDLFMVGGAVRNQNCSGSCTSITSGSQTVVAGTAYRVAADSSGGQSSIYWNGSSILGPSALTAAAAPWSTTTGIADNTVGVNHLDGIISRICIDPDPSRCR